MIKKILVLFVLLLTFHSTSWAQKKYHKDINTSLHSYIKSIGSKNSKHSLDFIDSDFFKYIPRETMLKSMTFATNNKYLNYRIDKPNINNIDEIIKVEDKYYTIVSYTTTIYLKFKDQDPPISKEDERKLIEKSLQQQKNPNLVSYDKNTGYYKYLEDKKLCATSKDNRKTWKFILLDPKQKSFLSKILPKKIIEKI